HTDLTFAKAFLEALLKPLLKPLFPALLEAFLEPLAQPLLFPLLHPHFEQRAHGFQVLHPLDGFSGGPREYNSLDPDDECAPQTILLGLRQPLEQAAHHIENHRMALAVLESKQRRDEIAKRFEVTLASIICGYRQRAGSERAEAHCAREADPDSERRYSRPSRCRSRRNSAGSRFMRFAPRSNST